MIILVSLFTYNFGWFNILLSALLVLSGLFLALVGISTIFFRRIRKGLLRVPMVIVLLCIFGIVLSLVLPYEPAISSSGDVSRDLEYAYQTDQSDRKNLRSYMRPFRSEMQERDSMRLAQVRMFYEQDRIKRPMDKFYAAFVYHHSHSKGDFETATKLAEEAADAEELKDHYQVQWLAKASYDRWMLSIGQPQRYDTQQKFSLELE